MFDCELLVKALDVDVLMAVVAEFNIAIWRQTSAPYLVIKVFPVLTTPPEHLAWGSFRNPMTFEQELFHVSILSHPKLMGSIGAKWVVLHGPSDGEYAQLMQLMIEDKSGSVMKLVIRAGEGIFEHLENNIKKSRQ